MKAKLIILGAVVKAGTYCSDKKTATGFDSDPSTPDVPLTCEYKCDETSQGCICPPCWAMADNKYECVPDANHVKVTCDPTKVSVVFSQCMSGRPADQASGFTVGGCTATTTVGSSTNELISHVTAQVPDPTGVNFPSFGFEVGLDQCNVDARKVQNPDDNNEDYLFFDWTVDAVETVIANTIVQYPTFKMAFQCQMKAVNLVSNTNNIFKNNRLSDTTEMGNIPNPIYSINTFSTNVNMNNPGGVTNIDETKLSFTNGFPTTALEYPDSNTNFIVGDTIVMNIDELNGVKGTDFFVKSCWCEGNPVDPYKVEIFEKCGKNPSVIVNAQNNNNMFGTSIGIPHAAGTITSERLSYQFEAFAWSDSSTDSTGQTVTLVDNQKTIVCELELCLNNPSAGSSCNNECA